ASLAQIPFVPGSGSLPFELRAGVDQINALGATVREMLESEQNWLRDRLALMKSRDSIMFSTVALGTVGSVGLIGAISFSRVATPGEARHLPRCIPARCWRVSSDSAKSS